MLQRRRRRRRAAPGCRSRGRAAGTRASRAAAGPCRAAGPCARPAPSTRALVDRLSRAASASTATRARRFLLTLFNHEERDREVHHVVFRGPALGVNLALVEHGLSLIAVVHRVWPTSEAVRHLKVTDELIAIGDEAVRIASLEDFGRVLDRLVDPDARPLVLTFRRRRGREIADLWEQARLRKLKAAVAGPLDRARAKILLETPMPPADENGALGAGMMDALRRSPSLSGRSSSFGNLSDAGRPAHHDDFEALDLSGRAWLGPASDVRRKPMDTPESWRGRSAEDKSRIHLGPSFAADVAAKARKDVDTSEALYGRKAFASTNGRERARDDDDSDDDEIWAPPAEDGLGARTMSFEMSVRSSPSVTRDESSGSLEALLAATSPANSPAKEKPPPGERFDVRGRDDEVITIERSDEARFLSRLDAERRRLDALRDARNLGAAAAESKRASDAERRAKRLEDFRERIDRNRRGEAASRLFDAERDRRVLEGDAPFVARPGAGSRFLMLRDVRRKPDDAALADARERCDSSPCELPPGYWERARRRQMAMTTDDLGASPRGSRGLKRSETWAPGDDEAAPVGWGDLIQFFCAADAHDETYYANTPGYVARDEYDDALLGCGDCTDVDGVLDEGGEP